MTTALSTAKFPVKIPLNKADLDSRLENRSKIVDVYFSTLTQAKESLFEQNEKAHLAKKREAEIVSNQEEVDFVNEVLKGANAPNAQASKSEQPGLARKICNVAAGCLVLLGASYATVLVVRRERPTLAMLASDRDTVIEAAKNGLQKLRENTPSVLEGGKKLASQAASIGTAAIKLLLGLDSLPNFLRTGETTPAPSSTVTAPSTSEAIAAEVTPAVSATVEAVENIAQNVDKEIAHII